MDERIPPPRRLRTAYAHFVQDNYHMVARELQTRRPQTIISRLGEMWRKLSPDERARFIEQEKRDRVRYDQAKMEWTRQHAGRPMGYMNRKRKEPNTPRRIATPYVIYKREMSEKLREEMRDATAREREREIIRRWRELPEEERRQYKAKSNEDKLRFAQELHEMRNREQERAAHERLQLQQLQDAPPPQGDAPPPAQGDAPPPAPAQGPAPGPGQEAAPAPVQIVLPAPAQEPAPAAVQVIPADPGQEAAPAPAQVVAPAPNVQAPPAPPAQ